MPKQFEWLKQLECMPKHFEWLNQFECIPKQFERLKQFETMSCSWEPGSSHWPNQFECIPKHFEWLKQFEGIPKQFEWLKQFETMSCSWAPGSPMPCSGAPGTGRVPIRGVSRGASSVVQPGHHGGRGWRVLCVDPSALVMPPHTAPRAQVRHSVLKAKAQVKCPQRQRPNCNFHPCSPKNWCSSIAKSLVSLESDGIRVANSSVFQSFRD